MPNLILIPFSVFFICGILQFWFLKRVRDALIDRHPQAFLAMEKSSIFPIQGVWKIVLGNRFKHLDDPELNRHIRNFKRLMAVGIVAWAAIAISFFTMPFDEPRLPIALANGSYANSCCGTLVLKDGRMTVAQQQIGYVIESDKQSPYVLPPIYVGASAHGFVVRRDNFPLKLRLDDAAHPAAIELMDNTDGSVFSFQRLRDR